MVIRLLRHSYDMVNPRSLSETVAYPWPPAIATLSENPVFRYGKVHFAKKTRKGELNVKYHGRYLKRPLVTASKRWHYSGGAVVHHFMTIGHNNTVNRHWHKRRSSNAVSTMLQPNILKWYVTTAFYLTVNGARYCQKCMGTSIVVRKSQRNSDMRRW